jgi:hypothetical protein
MAVDPGLMSGVVTLDTVSPFTLSTHELDFDQLVVMLDEMDVHGLPDVFVCESYIITPITAKLSRQYDALNIIGMLRYFSVSDNKPLHLQTPASAKGFTNDGKLRYIGWYETGKPHAMDAARHMFLWCTKTGIIKFNDAGLPSFYA